MRFLSENGEATQKQIAEGLGIPQPRVSTLLKQLTAEGLTEEVPDTYPKRYRLRASYTVIHPIKGVYNCITGDSADSPPALPDLFANRTPFESCISADQLDGWLQRATEDLFGLTPADADAVRVMLAYAEARGFPALVVDGYTIHGDMAGWLTAAQQLAGTPAVRTATRLLHALDASGIPLAPTPTTHTSDDAGCAPSQLPLLEG